MLEYCATCLSKDRRLTELSCLGPAVVSLNWNIQWNLERDGVCFECKGVLMKILRFRLQVETVGAQIALMRSTHKAPDTLRTFSSLSTTLKTAYDDVFQNTDLDVKDENYVEHDYEDSEILQKPETSFIDIKEVNFQINEETNISEEQDNLLSKPKNIAKKTKNKLKRLKTPAHGDFLRLTRIEEKFLVKRMTDEEMCSARESDMKRLRFRSATYKCLKCITGYYSEEKYNHHVKNKHCKALPHQCPICEVRFSRKDALRHHHENHYKSYRCKECDFSSHQLQTMLLHRDKEHEFKTYNCKDCGKGFITFTLLRYHTAKTHRERPRCDACGKAFVTAHSLKVHLKSHVPGAAARAQCPVCGGRYRQLAPHLRTHAAPARDAYCAECARPFRDAHTYRRHLLTHRSHRQSDALKHACAHCEAKFANKTNLTRHVSSKHTREFLFYCDTCGKGYHRKDRLLFHVQEVHQGVPRPKDKVCTVCGKSFKEHTVLRHHLRTHTGERPHACAHCAWRFAQRASLNAHVRARHPDKDAAQKNK